MRRVVVLPQPDGPRIVVKLPRGTSSDTRSTAAMSGEKRLLTFTSRRWASASGYLLQAQAAPTNSPDDGQYGHGHGDDGHREGRGAAPVEVVDEMEDGDGRHGRRRGKQENDHGQRGDSAHERGDEAGQIGAAQHREQHVAEGAQAAGTQARGG